MRNSKVSVDFEIRIKKLASGPILVVDSGSRFIDLSFHSQLCLQCYLLNVMSCYKTTKNYPSSRDRNSIFASNSRFFVRERWIFGYYGSPITLTQSSLKQEKEIYVATQCDCLQNRESDRAPRNERAKVVNLTIYRTLYVHKDSVTAPYSIYA